jgi:hypothetical protein
MKRVLRSIEDLLLLHKELRDRHDVLWSTVQVVERRQHERER